ncbi:uncharacterized protein B0P05DRAFT_525134 [Gilbertella persicaria]|uniref:uncharacterized protein n=1 Tax=Gilbertella persicaria TaxID=101096 RepID=UPI00221EAAD3|nr:uncharacterized protein B0P05DRAFT_525134 [Gilbertella persicaria]KAI8092183.1 hypothetical protein B0P05DRAFT_525134 [Gilbertella persicaria]
MYTLPASKIRRFPAKQEYLCEAIGEWGIIKDKLELVADVLCHPNRINRNYPKFDTQGEAEEYAFELVNQLLQKIENRKDVVNQSIFEERYGLKWIEEDQVQEDREEQTLVVLEDGQRSTDREDHDKQTSSNGVPNIAENSL